MKSLDALASLPLFLALLAGAGAVTSETNAPSQQTEGAWSTTNAAPLFVIGFVVILSISAVVMLVRETRRELKEKHQNKVD